jgi:hypothetical protein
LIGNRHTTKKDSTCGVEGGTTVTSLKYIVNMKTQIPEAWKAQQFLRISTHLIMAE